jgi:hypothetical protein
MPLRFDNFEACVCERESLTHRDTDTETGREREKEREKAEKGKFGFSHVKSSYGSSRVAFLS